jgi:hypothetical protein
VIATVLTFLGALRAGDVWAKLVAYVVAAMVAAGLLLAAYAHIKSIGAAETLSKIDRQNQEATDAAQKARNDAARRIDADPARGLCDAWSRDCPR